MLLFFVGVCWWWLARVPFHEDEAIYAAWALRVVRGDWLLGATPIDKPPLTLYPLALFIGVGARAEWLIRLPSLVWGGVALWAVGRVAENLGRDRWAARLLLLCSPLWWAMWASAFTDMAALALVLVALQSGAHGAARQARGTAGGRGEIVRGMALAGALLAKPTMLFLVPLVLMSPPGSPSKIEGGRTAKQGEQALTQEISMEGVWLSFTGVLLLAWAWDASRAAPSWWRLGAEAYGTLGQRAGNGAAWAWITAGSLGVMGIAYCVLRVAYYGAVRETGFQADTSQKNVNGETDRNSPRCRRFYYALLATVLLWVPLHILLGFQAWERYVLPLVPLVALLLSPRLSALSPLFRRWRYSLLLVGFLTPLLVAPLQFAPQDRRWESIDAMGAVIEALPPTAEVWYADMGRPLAWYAADATAALRWGGTHWAQFPGCGAGRYVVGRLTDGTPVAMTLVETRGQFGLWECDA